MPTPPCIVPSATIDLTLPANRLRAAARISTLPLNALRATPDGLYAQMDGSVTLRRTANQDVTAPLYGVAVEWDDAVVSESSWWSPLTPSKVDLPSGLWYMAWRIAAVAADASQLWSPNDATGVALVGDNGTTPVSSVSVVNAGLAFARFSPGPAGPWMTIGQRGTFTLPSGVPGYVDAFSGYVLVQRAASFEVQLTAPFNAGKAYIPGVWTGSYDNGSVSMTADFPAQFVATRVAPAPQ